MPRILGSYLNVLYDTLHQVMTLTSIEIINRVIRKQEYDVPTQQRSYNCHPSVVPTNELIHSNYKLLLFC